MSSKKTSDKSVSYKSNSFSILTSRYGPRLLPSLLLALFAFGAAPLIAQSPNTASMIVVVVDQNGAVVKDAKISVVNNATGALRETVSGSDGSANISALSLTGTYTV